MKNNRNNHEDDLLMLLRKLVPDEVEVTVLADRGFGDTKLYEFLEQARFKYVIRFRGAIQMRTEEGHAGPASEFLGTLGAPTRYDNVQVTNEHHLVPVLKP